MKQWIFKDDTFILVDEETIGDALEAAVELLKGYCRKHIKCEDGCKFYAGREVDYTFKKCRLANMPPTDWLEDEEDEY